MGQNSHARLPRFTNNPFQWIILVRFRYPSKLSRTLLTQSHMSIPERWMFSIFFANYILWESIYNVEWMFCIKWNIRCNLWRCLNLTFCTLEFFEFHLDTSWTIIIFNNPYNKNINFCFIQEIGMLWEFFTLQGYYTFFKSPNQN